MKTILLIVFLAFMCFGIKVYSDYRTDEQIHQTKIAQNPCITDWHYCKTIDQLMSDNETVHRAKFRCKTESRDHGAFGPPEWDGDWVSVPFSKYYAGSPFLKTGMIVLVDDKALVPNQYGGKERSTIECYYDLNKDEVSSIRILD